MADDIRFNNFNNQNDSKRSEKDERTATAGGVAITVVVVLLLGWGFYFFHEVQTGAVKPSLTGGTADQFNAGAMQAAQQALQQQTASGTEEFMQIRDEAAQQQAGVGGQMQVQQQTTGSTDQFGNPTSNY